MLAVKIPGKEQVEVVNESIPVPGKGEVLIEMKASALCRSDLHRYHGANLFDDDDDANITPGHEPCGVVAKLGENVTKVKKGNRVAIHLGLTCGVCPDCLAGQWVLCPSFGCIGFVQNGAHADYMIVPEQNCMLLPDEMSFIEGALATDVGGTLYTACKNLGVDGTKTVVIFGCGPMGSGGILMAKGFGARVIAVDINEERLELAKELGADVAIHSNEVDAVKTINELTNGKGAHCAIDCAGGNVPINNALNCVRTGGKVGMVAETDEAVIHPSTQFIRRLVELRGCWYFNRADWEEITNFIIERNIKLEKISSHTYTLQDAPEAFELFDSGKTQKAVFVWD